MLTGPRVCGFVLGFLCLVWGGLVMFGLVWSSLVWFGQFKIHLQTNKLNNYVILINLICEFLY